jgi:hypothetical protein
MTSTGRPFVECDDVARDADGVPTSGVRCARRSFGRRDRFDDGPELSLWDLPAGWSVAPFSDDFDHGVTRVSLLDGTPIPPIPHHVGLRGDLHTCPSHRASRTTSTRASATVRDPVAP